MNTVVITYLIYLPIALILTYLVAKIFFKNSKIFMMDIFRGREIMANSTNKLFEMGFYLFNLGFALFIMKVPEHIAKYNYDRQEMFEVLSTKIGTLTIILGCMVFFNLFMLFRGKKASALKNRKTPPPFKTA